MDFSCGLDFDKKEALIPLTGESREMRNSSGASGDLWPNGFEFNSDFWPIEHPMEPPDEDQPVKCPIPPHSSVINEDGFSDSLRKRTEASRAMNKQATVMMVASTDEPPARALRKRHCRSTTNGDHRTLTSSNPFRTLPPIRPPNPARHDLTYHLQNPPAAAQTNLNHDDATRKNFSISS